MKSIAYYRALVRDAEADHAEFNDEETARYLKRYKAKLREALIADFTEWLALIRINRTEFPEANPAPIRWF